MFNTPVECWGCTDPPKYNVDRFHTYGNYSNKRYLEVSEQAKHSIQEYAQLVTMKGGIRGDQDIQGQHGQTYSIAMHYMFAERRVQITRSCKEEGFGSLDPALLMCEMMDPSTSRSFRLACAGDLKRKYER